MIQFTRPLLPLYFWKMDIFKTIFTHWFFWGFMAGLFLCVLSMIAHFKTGRELKRLKGHLSDKLELDAEKLTGMKDEITDLKKQNDNLRIKINTARVQDDAQAMEHELEIYARAEKAMVMNAPGFAQVWEKAKENAFTELEEEEQGRSLPRRIFKRFFSNSGGSADAEEIEVLPSKSTAIETGEKSDD